MDTKEQYGNGKMCGAVGLIGRSLGGLSGVLRLPKLGG